MGSAMKPELGAFDRPAGPQMVSEAPDAEPIGPFDDRLAYADYSGQIPEYVLGTDWTKLLQAPLPVSAAEAEPSGDAGYEYATPQAEVGTFTTADYRTPVEAPVSFPSLDGGAAYEDVSRAEKTPVSPLTDLDPEAPPEATGDTTPAT